MTYFQRLKQYESEKQSFIRNNPNASPEQYQQAMRALADKWGI